MALFEKHRGLWRRLRPASERRRRGDLGRNRQLALEILEIRVTPTTSTWIGAGLDTDWSNPANWDTAPVAGSDLVFPASAVNQTSTNDLPAGTSFASLTITSSTGAGGYVIGGNAIALAGVLEDDSPSNVHDTVGLPIELDGPATVTVSQSGATLLLQGAITGTSGLTQTGAGIVNLQGANTYSGNTNVNGGVLFVNTTQPGSPVTVAAGATLGGNGTVGAITASGGKVSPGTSTPAILNDAGNLVLSSSSTFTVALNGPNPGSDYSQLTVAGTVTLGGATLSATAVPMSVGNHSFTIIDNMGGSAVSGTFAGLPQGAELTISNTPYQISYTGGADGHDVVLTSLVNTTTSVTPSATSVTYGSPISLTATVVSADSSFAQPPTGSVQFFNGSTQLGTAPLVTNGLSGMATLDNVILPAGTNGAIVGVYSGDTSFAVSTSPAATAVTVAQAATNTSLSVTPSSLVSGQTVALSATVSPTSAGGVALTGTVNFYSGTPATGRFLGAAAVTGGVANFNTPGLTAADTSITAQYLGDNNYLASTSSGSAVSVSHANTTVALTIAPNPSGIGTPVTFTAVISVSPPGSGIPTGNVQFFNGSTLLGTQALNNLVAMFTTSSLPLGATTITATYVGDSNFNSSTSQPGTATVINASTTTVTASLGSIVFGQSETLTATVVPASGTTPVPTGNVQFLNGNNAVGTVTLSNGVAVLNTSSLPTGTLSITAQYQGDSNYAQSTSTAITVVVAKASTTTTVTVTPNPSGLGQTATLKATIAAVSPGAGTATGTVQFFNGATSLGTGTLSAGVATLPTTALTLGANSITAVYQGDGNFTTSTSPVFTANVNQGSTTTLAANPQTAVTGQAVALTATVAPASGTGTPTGTVQFFNGTISLGTSPVNSSGVAVLSTTSLVVGTPSLTAIYSGDSTFAGSTSPATTVTVTKAATNTAVAVVPNPSASGASVTLNATITVASPGSGTPTGSVQFFNGSTSLGTGTLNNTGTASINSSAVNVGANSITAVYAGDANFTTSTSPVFTQNVLPATTTTVASQPSPSVVGQPVTLTAGVSSTAGVPDGTVRFLSGTTVLGTGTLSGGVASLVTSALTFGFNTITANYLGSGSFSPSTSLGITQTVQQASTTTSITSSANPSGLGQSVTFTATVSPAAPSTGGPTPTGSLTFMDGTTTLGSVNLTNGVATFTTSSLTTGSHSITTVYVNDGNYSSSTGALTQVVSLSSPTVVLSIPTANPVSNESIVLTAVVNAVSPATAVPTGTVNFFSNGDMIGSGTLTNGVATFTLSNFALGDQTLTAVYQGDTNFSAGASSAPLPIKVGDGNQLFVNQLFLDLLNTVADPQGLANYTTLLANGYARKSVVHQVASLNGLLKGSKLQAAVLRSTPAPGGGAALVHSLYKATLGRQPSARELKSGVAQVKRRGGTNTLILSLLSSKAYFDAAFAQGSIGAVASPNSRAPGSIS